MENKLTPPLSCPICKKKVTRQDHPFFPFCSERCKMIDLGAWLDGRYAFEGGEPAPGEDLEETY